MSVTVPTASVAKKYALTDNWYVDTYEVYTEVGFEHREAAGGFVAHLEDRDVDYRVVGSESGYIIHVYGGLPDERH